MRGALDFLLKPNGLGSYRGRGSDQLHCWSWGRNRGAVRPSHHALISFRHQGTRVSLCFNRNTQIGAEQFLNKEDVLTAVCSRSFLWLHSCPSTSCPRTKDNSSHGLLPTRVSLEKAKSLWVRSQNLHHYKVFLRAAGIPWASPSTSPVERIVSICVWGQ